VTKNGEGLGIRANDHGGGPVAEILALLSLNKESKVGIKSLIINIYIKNLLQQHFVTSFDLKFLSIVCVT
jgi:hypothetical protein